MTLVNPGLRPEAVPPPRGDAYAFHASLPGYAPTPVRGLPALAAEFGVRSVALKDESDRLGLPAFKILGASWAIERALRATPGLKTLVAASAGNHGRAVAREAARRGLACRIFLPKRSVAARRDAIAAEGAELIVVEGSYEDALGRAAEAAAAPDACRDRRRGRLPARPRRDRRLRHAVRRGRRAGRLRPPARPRSASARWPRRPCASRPAPAWR